MPPTYILKDDEEEMSMTLKKFEICLRDRLDEFVESYKLKHSKYPEAYQIENIIDQWWDVFDDMFPVPDDVE